MSTIMDFGGLDYRMRNLFLGSDSPGATGTQVFDTDTEGFTLPGALIGSTQELSGAGAVDLVSLTTFVTTTGADALTLADGTEGQVKVIIMVVDGGAGTLTPTNYGNGSTLTFDDVGDSVMLVFRTGNWWNVGTPTATVA